MFIKINSMSNDSCGRKKDIPMMIRVDQIVAAEIIVHFLSDKPTYVITTLLPDYRRIATETNVFELLESIQFDKTLVKMLEG